MNSIEPGQIYYRKESQPSLLQISQLVHLSSLVVFDQYQINSNGLKYGQSLVQHVDVFLQENQLLTKSGQMGKWPIGSLISHRGKVYEVLGYFRRFIAVRHLDSLGLEIIKRYHPSNHKYIMI